MRVSQSVMLLFADAVSLSLTCCTYLWLQKLLTLNNDAVFVTDAPAIQGVTI